MNKPAKRITHAELLTELRENYTIQGLCDVLYFVQSTLDRLEGEELEDLEELENLDKGTAP